MALGGRDFYRIGKGLLEEGNPAEALHQLRLAEQELPDDYDVNLALGRTLVALGQTTEAGGYFRRNVESHPDRAETYLEWAALSLKQGRKDEAKRLKALAKVNAGYQAPTEEVGRAAWEPEASAPKPGQVAFRCPNCGNPILHGSDEMACSKCRQNLLPLRHHHIRINHSLDGTDDYRCVQCNNNLTGKETSCPHCGTNLLTGSLPDEPQQAVATPSARPQATPKPRSKKSWIVPLVGLLLLFVGIGQLRTPGRQQEIGHGWSVLVHRLRPAPAPVAPPTSDHVRAPEMDTSVEASEKLPKDFIMCAGLILLGGLIIVLWALKATFDQ